MTDQDRTANFLIRAVGKGYCDNCLSKALDIPSEEVGRQASALAEEAWFKRREGQCAGCGSLKVVSRRRISSFAA
jgi:hypothetical protein